jgi:Family of unknown function (DUF6295)
MCTYATEQCAVSGSGKAAMGWFSVSLATAYVDHPVHAAAAHTVNIDFAAPRVGPAARVAVELTTDSAIRVMEAVARALLSAPADISGLDEPDRARLASFTSPTKAAVSIPAPEAPRGGR